LDQARSAPPPRRPYALLGLLSGAAFAAVMTVPLFLLPLGGYAFLPAAALYAFSMGYGYLRGKGWTAQTEGEAASAPGRACPKVLDTSAIIDGRILDICRTGFLEGDIVVPSFVLDELRHIADSADTLRRGRGRRGLDVLQKLQEEVPLRIEEKDDYDGEVDVKLLRLARDLKGAVMTNDYNLNKVAGVAGVPVLNVNDLAGALRPNVLPGEEMTVRVIREGREPGQGVAYLEDGTMVVVENGRRRVGETLNAEVTTVLQTSAGRMIFARVPTDENRAG